MKMQNEHTANLAGYVNNNISTEAQHEMEKKAQGDPFLSDAIDGFKEFPKELGKAPRFNQNKREFIYLVSAIVITTGMTIFFLIANNQKANTPVEIATVTVTPNKPTTEHHVTQTTVFAKTNNENLLENKDITTPVIDTTTKEVNTAPVRENIVLETLTDGTIAATNTSTTPNTINNKWKTVGYHNFIGIDYTDKYEKNNASSFFQTGTLANKPNKQLSNNIPREEIREKQYTYREYLETIFESLAQKQFNNALEKIDVLLAQYPDDVNGQFYKGFIYFQGSQYKKAIIQFDATLQNYCDYFAEDAIWYKAQALEYEGDLKSAAKLYQKIANRNGYYAIQARNKGEKR